MPFQPRPDRPPIVINIPNRAPSTTQRGAGTSPSSSTDSLRRRVIGWLVALTTAGVLFCGMFPFDFVFHWATAGDDFRRRFDWTIDQLYTAGDGLENIVFFMPTGFALAALLLRRHRPQSGATFSLWPSIGRAAAVALPLGAGLSTLVECSQVYLQSRDPSLADICSNTTGTVVGFVLFLFVGNTVLKALTQAARRVDLWLIPSRSRLLAILWLLIAAIAPLLYLDAGSLADWNPAFPMILGNETTGDRWWNGAVNGVWVADRGLTDAELERTLSGGDVSAIIGSGLQANYAFVGRGPYVDKTGTSGSLHWKAANSPAENPVVPSRATAGPSELVPPLLTSTTLPIAQLLGRDWWLQTDNNALAQAMNRIKKSQAFSVICDVQTDDLDQHDGPPRIMSISAGTTQCNLQLLQEADQLIVRLRTVASGEGGSDPEFVLPYAFVDPSPRRIVVRYDHDVLMVTTDHIGERDRFRYTPESSLIWKAYPRPGWAFRLDSSGQNACANIYRLLALFPIGFLLGRGESSRNGNARRPGARFFIAALLAVVILETSLAVQSGQFPEVLTLVTACISVLLGSGTTAHIFTRLKVA